MQLSKRLKKLEETILPKKEYEFTVDIREEDEDIEEFHKKTLEARARGDIVFVVDVNND